MSTIWCHSFCREFKCTANTKMLPKHKNTRETEKMPQKKQMEVFRKTIMWRTSCGSEKLTESILKAYRIYDTVSILYNANNLFIAVTTRWILLLFEVYLSAILLLSVTSAAVPSHFCVPKTLLSCFIKCFFHCVLFNFRYVSHAFAACFCLLLFS